MSHDKATKKLRDVKLWGYSKLIITWPIAVIGPILWCIDAAGWGNPITLMWIYFGVVGFCMLAGFIDLKRGPFFGWLAFIVALVFGGIILYLKWGVNIFQPIRDFFAEVESVYSKTLFLKISLLWMIVLALVWVNAWLNHRWVMTFNDVRRKRVLASSRVYRKAQIRVTEEFYDMLEFILLFGGGRVRFTTPQGHLIDDAQHVPRLAWKWPKVLDHLASTEVIEDDQVVAGEDAASAVAAEEVS